MAGQPPQYMPPPPPPPPPGYGESFMKKPTSGIAIASLICGVVGLIGFGCWPIAITALVGLVLGVVGMFTTGKEGTRSGRGLAIAGTIVSVLAIGGTIASVGAFVFLVGEAEKQVNEAVAQSLDRDQRLILERMKKYYNENDKSLAPGGPVQNGPKSTTPRTDNQWMPMNDVPANGLPSNDEPADTRARVTGALTLEHLVNEHELSYGRNSGGGMGWDLKVTGKASATLEARDWGGNVIREVVIQDIGRDQILQTDNFGNE